MREYRLSKRANDDLMTVARYGDEKLGVAQSNRYREQLNKHFSVPAEQPLLYPAVDHNRRGYRQSVRAVHSIYYRIEADGVEIMRVLKHQEPGKAL